MRKALPITILLLTWTMFFSCGGKPGGLKNLEDIVPEFASRLNEACSSGNFSDLMRLFDKNAVLTLDTEFNPEIYHGVEKIRNYFIKIPLDTEFEIGNVKLKSLLAETEYSYIQKNGAVGHGKWIFKLNNMGEVSEMSIEPGEEMIE